MLHQIVLLFVTILSNIVLLGPCLAQAPCSEDPSSNILASAGTWDNLRNSENSIKFKIGNLIKSATEGKAQTTFTISSKPNKYLSSYSDKEYCEKKLVETSNNKLAYGSQDLGSLDALNSWIAEFSQGKGKAGGDLYSQCDKSCSPSYEYQITYSGGATTKYQVKALVVCGHARDKDDNQYSLTLVCKG